MIELVTFTEDDFPRLLHWIQSPELLVQWAGPGKFTYPLTRDQLEAYLQESQGESPRSMIYKVVHGEADVVGHIELCAINRENGTASICRVFLDPAWRGKGLCLEMVRSVLQIGFDQLKLRRIDLRVLSFNQPAICCYERAGLVREGVLRKAQRFGDGRQDTVLMGILREAWRGD